MSVYFLDPYVFIIPYCKCVLQSCTTILGIIMLVSVFVYQDPTLQDRYRMIAHVIIALGVMGTWYIPTIANHEEM
jgi:hypothetical protein